MPQMPQTVPWRFVPQPADEILAAAMHHIVRSEENVEHDQSKDPQYFISQAVASSEFLGINEVRCHCL